MVEQGSISMDVCNIYYDLKYMEGQGDGEFGSNNIM